MSEMTALRTFRSAVEVAGWDVGEERAPGSRRYTCFLKWTYGEKGDGAGDGFVEIGEIDIDAKCGVDAAELAKIIATEDYVKGWTLVGCEERVGWYL